MYSFPYPQVAPASGGRRHRFELWGFLLVHNSWGLPRRRPGLLLLRLPSSNPPLLERFRQTKAWKCNESKELKKFLEEQHGVVICIWSISAKASNGHKLVRSLVVPVEVGQELGGGAGGVERHGGEPGGAEHIPKPLLGMDAYWIIHITTTKMAD